MAGPPVMSETPDMTPVHGTRLTKSWFTASTRKLESLLPYLSDTEADQVCEELSGRDAQHAANRGAMNGLAPEY